MYRPGTITVVGWKDAMKAVLVIILVAIIVWAIVTVLVDEDIL